MAFKPGVSGNPRGRRPGTGRVAKLREQVAEHEPAIVKRLVDAALDGDMVAIRILIDRLWPALKAVDEPVRVEMSAEATLAERGDAVLQAACNGKITPQQAATLMSGLAAHVRVIETSELEARIEALETANAKPE